jgi:hypothetical protein
MNQPADVSFGSPQFTIIVSVVHACKTAAEPFDNAS